MKLNIKKIAKDKIGEYVVSTVNKDGVCETAICKGKGDYIVVQLYTDEVRATVGHKYWKDYAAKCPLYATDVTTNKQTLF